MRENFKRLENPYSIGISGLFYPVLVSKMGLYSIVPKKSSTFL